MKKISAVTLSVFEIFKNLGETDRAAIAESMIGHQFDAGTFVISPHDNHRRVYFIVSGAVRACSASTQGTQVYFQDLSPGMMFGEVAVIDGKERTSDCVATAESWVLSMSDKRFLALIDQYPEVNRAVLLRLASMVRYQCQRVYEYTSYNVNQRIRFELIRLAANEPGNEKSVVFNSVPTQLELAERVCSHREAVCKELKRLSDAGYIRWKRGEHVILDLPGLVMHASEK